MKIKFEMEINNCSECPFCWEFPTCFRPRKPKIYECHYKKFLKGYCNSPNEKYPSELYGCELEVKE